MFGGIPPSDSHQGFPFSNDRRSHPREFCNLRSELRIGLSGHCVSDLCKSVNTGNADSHSISRDAFPKKQRPALLALPAELRDSVYENVLGPKCFRVIVAKNHHDKQLELWTVSSLMHTCRQIRQEARDLHYGSKSFLICNWDILNYPNRKEAKNVQSCDEMTCQ